ncbi:MAG: DNA polymerase III subunit epsilon [Candidatus Competibacterales bacterium]|nr:DNA polymerase III subunit epsilon [Candidatus Competibacterales bacterium]
MHGRQIVLDTETTGLDPAAGHRIIEIGAVELVNRRLTGRHWHHYLRPDRPVDPDAFAVHGISDDFLADKPRFEDLAAEFLDFVRDAELLIHNASFDVGFLDHELKRWGGSEGPLEQCCLVTDTLALARRKFPGQRNSLDALCKRLDVDNSNRDLHGALLDAEILARVYLVMTREQMGLGLDSATSPAVPLAQDGPVRGAAAARNRPLRIVTADQADLDRQARFFERNGGRTDEPRPWDRLR